MAKPKVRFGVIADNETREIFAVREGPDGGLTIIRRTPKGIVENERLLTIDEQHFSIHRSKQSKLGATTITQKTILGGDIRSRILLMEDTNEYLLAHVYTATSGYVRSGKNALRPRKRDEWYVLPFHYNQDETTLIYSVYVGLRNMAAPEPDISTSIIMREFQYYSLFVCVCFIPIPTPSLGVSLFSATSSQRTNGIADTALNSTPAKSLASTDFAADHHHWVTLASIQASLHFQKEIMKYSTSDSFKLDAMNYVINARNFVSSVPIRGEETE